MAKYAISEEGVSQLQKLSKGIISDTENIYEAGISLKNNISSLREGLGIYENEIIDLVNHNQATLQSNREVFKQLSDSIVKKADEICSMMGFENNNINSSQTDSTYRARLISNNSKFEKRDKLWNETYMPLGQANIRKSVERLFSNYVSNEKLEESLDKLKFMDQYDLRQEYGKGFQKGTLGFNDGENSFVAHDIKGPVQESGDTLINFAFATAVHETLHMFSANDAGNMIKRGVMINNDSRAMNEAITEYFTFLSLGGDTPLGGLYPGTYSGYTTLMHEIPKLEKAIGSETLKEAYFYNKPELIAQKVDSVCGNGAWQNLCEDFDVIQYGGGDFSSSAERIRKTLFKLNNDIY